MKKLVAFIILLAAAGGGVWYYYKYAKPVEKPQVVQAAISQGDIIEQVSATGTLEPLRRVDVGSQVSGVVKALYVDFNSIVRKGQLLAEIDPALLEVQVQIRNAAIERQKSDIANQEVQLEDLKKQLERTKSLFDKGLQNQQQLEQAQLAIKNREAQINSARKSLVSAEADLSQAALNVSYTKIHSPIDGVVVDRKVDIGQTVQASTQAPSFFILATPLQQLKLTAGVDEADIGKIRSGMDVTFTVDAYGQTPFHGTVDAVRLNATTQNNVVTYPVWIEVPNADLRLRPSLTAAIKIIISTAPDVVRVPNTALRFRPNNDIYLALGVTPPAAGGGRALGAPGDVNGDPSNRAGRGQGGRPGGLGASAQAPGRGQQTPPAQQPAQGQRAQGGTRDQSGQAGQPRVGGGDRPSGRGFREQSGVTPEQMQAFRERMARGGRGGGGQGGGRGEGGFSGRGGQASFGGQGGGRGGRGQAPPANVAPQTSSRDQKIDEQFAPVQRPETRASVWTWDEAKKELKQINLRLGVTDGTFSELLSGDVKVAQQVVTGVILPRAQATSTTQNPLFGNQPGRGGPGGFGGQGGPGGGGGQRGGGGGGGGRGGGN